MIWYKDYTVDYLEGLRNANTGTHIGIEFTETGEKTQSFGIS